MNWKFTLIDRDNVSTEIKEPVGFDGMSINLERDMDKHGIMIDFQGNDFEIHGNGYRLIKDEYDAYGAEGDMTMVIEWGCNDDYEELHRGKLNFPQANFESGKSCFVNISIETMSDVMEVINRIDQSVNLLADKAFDGTTELTAYDRLGFDLTLPSKGILLQDKAENDAPSTTDVLGSANDSITGGVGAGMIGIPLKQLVSEIGGYYTNDTIGYDDIGLNGIGSLDAIDYGLHTYLNTHIISPTVNYAADFPNWRQISDVIDTHIHFSGTITNLLPDLSSGVGLNGIRIFFLRLPGGKSGDVISDYDVISAQTVYAHATDPLKTSATFSYTYDNAAFVLNENDRLYLSITVSYQKHYTQYDDNAFSIAFDTGGYFRMTTLSHTAPTLTKAFMINEVLSRIVESISNGKMRAYSDYFGRTDSEPYIAASDGCGSLEIISKGLFIRRQENRNGDTAVIGVSLNNAWEGLNPIHNIGYGFEPDTERPGYNRLRVENWKYFYSNDVILECIGVAAIKRKVIEKDHYSTFQFGYEKWEAEEFNGLDEFLTKRNFRTSLSQIKNNITQLSKWVGSGYAWEITRRKGDQDSKDWRFDNDIFIACVKRNIDAIEIELGNVTTPENIIDPDTVYNWRIRPVYNAMRWFDRIVSSYRQVSNSNKILFMDGEGNYFAKGEMTSATCKLENQVIAENDPINAALYDDTTKAAAILRPERVEYEFPMSVKDFKTVKANPRGLVYFENEDEAGHGWIDKISYHPQQGLTSFTLIPKYV